MLSYKNFALSALAGLALIPAVASEMAMMTGYIMDNQCINLCKDREPFSGCTPDGSNAFYSPQEHTGWCLLLSVCVSSGYTIVSEFPTEEDGRHSILMELAGEASQEAAVSFIKAGTTGAFPRVTVVYDTELTEENEEGMLQVMNATIKDPWDVVAEDGMDYYSGANTTQVLCSDSTSPDILGNNMCFRSDVAVSVQAGSGNIVIESNGCPDHDNMVGSNGTIPNFQEDPTSVMMYEESSSCGGGGCGCGGTCGGNPCGGCGGGCGGGCDGGCHGGCGSSCAGNCGACQASCASNCGGGGACQACASECSAVGGNPCAAGGNPCAAGGNPCAAGGNPCAAGGNPCAAGGNPCAAGGNPCAAGGNPCAAGGNPCAAVGNPCAAGGNPCAASNGDCGASNACGASCGSSNACDASCGASPKDEPGVWIWSKFSVPIVAKDPDGGRRMVCAADDKEECGACYAGCGTEETCGAASCGSGCDAGCGTAETCEAASCGSGCYAGCGTEETCEAALCGSDCSPICQASCASGCSSCGSGCQAETCGCGSECGSNPCEGGCGCNSCGCGCGSTGTCGDAPAIGKYQPLFQHYTMVIPSQPVVGNKTIMDDDVVGILSNGVLLDSHKQTWAYDMCNGHSDMKHQYHYHIPPICLMESMGVSFAEDPSWWINDEGNATRDFSEMADQFPDTGPASPVIGFARDGHPIFGPYDDAGSLQRGKEFGGDVDECNGKMDSNGKYGYYMTVDPPFAPPCLKGEVGLFTYSTSELACPKEGIVNTIMAVEPEDEDVAVVSKTLGSTVEDKQASNSGKEEMEEADVSEMTEPEDSESALPSGTVAFSLSTGALIVSAVLALVF